MSIYGGDVSDFRKAAVDLAKMPAKAVPALRVTMGAAGEAFADDWRNNARATSGEHGRYYPDSITAELALTVGSVAVDVGPDSSRKQGGMGMGFEFGSRNQPPHLDGLRAMDAAVVRTEQAIDTAMGKVWQ